MRLTSRLLKPGMVLGSSISTLEWRLLRQFKNGWQCLEDEDGFTKTVERHHSVMDVQLATGYTFVKDVPDNVGLLMDLAAESHGSEWVSLEYERGHGWWCIVPLSLKPGFLDDLWNCRPTRVAALLAAFADAPEKEAK